MPAGSPSRPLLRAPARDRPPKLRAQARVGGHQRRLVARHRLVEVHRLFVGPLGRILVHHQTAVLADHHPTAGVPDGTVLAEHVLQDRHELDQLGRDVPEGARPARPDRAAPARRAARPSPRNAPACPTPAAARRRFPRSRGGRRCSPRPAPTRAGRAGTDAGVSGGSTAYPCSAPARPTSVTNNVLPGRDVRAAGQPARRRYAGSAEPGCFDRGRAVRGHLGTEVELRSHRAVGLDGVRHATGPAGPGRA